MIDEIYHNNVRYLGNLLGEIIREQEGDETFNPVSYTHLTLPTTPYV